MARLTHQKWFDNIDLTKEHSYKHIYKRLWEIENMLENNRLIELPCKVGDTIYLLLEHVDSSYYIVESKCLGYKLIENSEKVVMYINCPIIPNYLNMDKLIYGKTVFSSLDEAEKALKRNGGNG